LYGLGSGRQDLPAYVVLSDPGGVPVDGAHNWSSGYLPAVYQGTPLRATGTAVANLHPPREVSVVARRNPLHFLDELNAAHLKRHVPNRELEARIRNFGLAARMQTAVPTALDLARETEEIRRLVRLDNTESAARGR